MPLFTARYFLSAIHSLRDISLLGFFDLCRRIDAPPSSLMIDSVEAGADKRGWSIVLRPSVAVISTTNEVAILASDDVIIRF